MWAWPGGRGYLLQVVGRVEDVELLAAEQRVDQLLDHRRLLVDDGQVQRTVGKTEVWWSCVVRDRERGQEVKED